MITTQKVKFRKCNMHVTTMRVYKSDAKIDRLMTRQKYPKLLVQFLSSLRVLN